MPSYAVTFAPLNKTVRVPAGTTLLEAAGLTVPRTVDGCSLLPLLRAPASEWRTHIHGEHCTCYSVEQEMQYVTDGRRKFVWLPRTGIEQFFDLQEGPGELFSLIDEPARRDEVAAWRERLVRELESRDCGWAKNGSLLCPSDAPLVSPFKEVRWQGD